MAVLMPIRINPSCAVTTLRLNPPHTPRRSPPRTVPGGKRGEPPAKLTRVAAEVIGDEQRSQRLRRAVEEIDHHHQSQQDDKSAPGEDVAEPGAEILPERAGR